MQNYQMYIRNVIKLTKPIRYFRVKRFNAKLGNRDDAEKAIQSFLGENITADERDKLVEDMIMMSKNYRYGYDEFFLFHFMEKPLNERLEFVADLDRIDIVETMNRAINEPLFDDKSRTYKKYGEYYGRELLACGGGI